MSFENNPFGVSITVEDILDTLGFLLIVMRLLLKAC